MSCLIKKHITSSIFVYLLVLFAFVFYSHDVSALSDFSVTSSNGSNIVVCAPASWRLQVPECTGYKYLSVTLDDTYSPNTDFYFNSSPTFGTIRVSSLSSFILNFPDLTASDYLRITINNYSSGSSTWTISDSAPSSGSCPDPEPCPSCPVCPVVPENPYDEKLDEILHAVYIGIASLFVLYFFYCIYRMIIKGVK